MLCIENPKHNTKNLLYTNNELPEKEIKTTIFTITSKKIKYLGIILISSLDLEN